MAIPIEMIKQLREETGAGVLDCRKALERVNGDYETALAALREKALTRIAARSERRAAQGLLELYSHGGGRIGVMVEVNAETDFAARSEAFRAFAHEVALQIAAAAPLYVRDEEIPAEVLAEVSREAAARAHAAGKAEALVPRITAGMLEKYKDEKVLLRQFFIRDEGITMAGLLSQAAARVGENIVIRRFVRWEIGEGDKG